LSLHSLLPLVALLFNLALAGIAIIRNPGSRLNRLFVYFVSTMAVWNLGVFMLRRTGDPASAEFWEAVIHVGVAAGPVFYYHFALVFLDSIAGHRPSLALGYALMAVFTGLSLTSSPLLMRGVTWTHWGWAPVPGPVYGALLVHLYGFFTAGLVRLGRAYRTMDSSFRRNRTVLVMLGAVMTIGGGFFDFVRFIAAKAFPAADAIYPVGIPANMVCALMLGTSIVRYRMFDVDAAVKKTAVYAAVGAVLTGLLGALVWGLGSLGLHDATALWLVVPLGVLMTLLLTPLGRRLEAVIQRLIFSRRRGCYETLLALSKRMSIILDLNALMETLVRGLVRGVPLTHAVLLTRDPATGHFVVARAESAVERDIAVPPVRPDRRLVEWLRQADGALVKEELKLNPRIASYFDAAENELEEINAALVVPLKIEGALTGILLLGEKLSGEVFDEQELELLSLLGNQAAIALANAQLYAELHASNVRLREASRLKSQFLASMSHELRTPLNSIIGFSKVLLNRTAGELNERQEAYVRSVHNSSTHLLELINDILDISRIEAGKLEMSPEEVDLAELVAECVEATIPLVRGKVLKVETEVPSDLPRVHADRTKLKQVVLNMLSNAVKFTPAGRVVLRVAVEGDTVHVSVSDTGVGIPADDLPRLFKPFERLENPLTRAAGGTGLGLAISKKFVEMHGGTIWVESVERQGSTFHFTLPVGSPAVLKR